MDDQEKFGDASDLVPKTKSLDKVREASKHCTACPLFKNATQTVFGEGSKKARVIFIGEQPGNDEDLQGRPFVGPAGRILDRALKDAGIKRSETYVTNAVKHFKFRRVGKRRIHERPRGVEIKACKAWLESEINLISPRVIVCLGATASQSIFGSSFRVTKHRGEIFSHSSGAEILTTIHPSAILRAPDDKTRHLEYQSFVEDLRLIPDLLSTRSRKRIL